MNDLLNRMMDADPKLYQRILDTTGFAFAFNQLCRLAGGVADVAVAAERERCAKVAEEAAADWTADAVETPLGSQILHRMADAGILIAARIRRGD